MSELYIGGYTLKDVRIVHDKCGTYMDCISHAYMSLNVAIMFDRYLTGKMKPNYPVPAIPLAVKYDYVGCVNIDDVTDVNDPVIVWMYDSWTQQNA